MGIIVTLLMKNLSYRESVAKVIHLLHTVPRSEAYRFGSEVRALKYLFRYS